MKLREYLESMEPGSELTCWDKDVDSEFYFYAKDTEEKEEQDEDFWAVDACMDKLAAMLDVLEVRERGVVVNLYDMLDHNKVIQFAKDNFYLPHQYEDDEDIVMLLFDDNDSNITNGFFEFSRDMVKCLEQAYGIAGEKYPISQIKELEKHLDGEEHVRVGIAQMGIRLDRYVIDESWQVRKAVAENGYGLEFLMDDPHWAVRKAVAMQGHGIESLLNDKDERVVQAARVFLKKDAWKSEMDERMRQRHSEDGIDDVIAEAKERSDSFAKGENNKDLEIG